MANLEKVVYLTEAQKETLFTNGTLTANGNTINYNDNDLYITPEEDQIVYENKAAASGGTAVSLVTTGEKYNWNNKGTYSKPSDGIPDSDIASASTWNAKATKPTKKSISLSATWLGSGPYTQTVTVSGYTITANSKVDLQPDATTVNQLIIDGVKTLYIENNNGTLTAYAVGAAAPTAALTIQCTIMEVNA